MSDLYDKIGTAEKFVAPCADTVQRDLSGQVSLGLEFAQRAAERPPEAAPVRQMAPIVPVAN